LSISHNLATIGHIAMAETTALESPGYQGLFGVRGFGVYDDWIVSGRAVKAWNGWMDPQRSRAPGDDLTYWVKKQAGTHLGLDCGLSNDERGAAPLGSGTASERFAHSQVSFAATSDTSKATSDHEATFKKGDKIQVWSNSKRTWFDGVVEETYSIEGIVDGFPVQNGTVKVSCIAGLKYVQPDQVENLLRRPDTDNQRPSKANPPMQGAAERKLSKVTEESYRPVCAYAKGAQVQVWSNSQQAWLSGEVLEVFPDGGKVDEYIVPPGTIKVISGTAKIRYVRPEQVDEVLRNPCRSSLLDNAPSDSSGSAHEQPRTERPARISKPTQGEDDDLQANQDVQERTDADTIEETPEAAGVSDATSKKKLRRQSGGSRKKSDVSPRQSDVTPTRSRFWSKKSLLAALGGKKEPARGRKLRREPAVKQVIT